MRPPRTTDSSLRDVIVHTGLAFLANMSNYTGPSVWANGRTADAIHYQLPNSTAAGPFNNTGMEAFLSKAFAGMKKFTITPLKDIEPVVDVETRRVVIHASGLSVTDKGTYPNEFMWTFGMTEDGKLIKESWEYTDSLLTSRFGKNSTTS